MTYIIRPLTEQEDGSLLLSLSLYLPHDHSHPLPLAGELKHLQNLKGPLFCVRKHNANFSGFAVDELITEKLRRSNESLFKENVSISLKFQSFKDRGPRVKQRFTCSSGEEAEKAIPSAVSSGMTLLHRAKCMRNCFIFRLWCCPLLPPHVFIEREVLEVYVL